MRITFEGCGTPEMINELETSAHLFAKELLSARMLPHIHLFIVIRSNMREHGMCTPCWFNSAGKPRGFEIELRKKKSIKSIVSTLAHELVHVKQFAVGDMNEYDSNWKGKRVDIRKLSYEQLPWEEEAFSEEKRLYKLYKMHKIMR